MTFDALLVTQKREKGKVSLCFLRVIDIIKQNTTTPSHTKISIKRKENSLLSLKKVPLYVIL